MKNTWKNHGKVMDFCQFGKIGTLSVAAQLNETMTVSFGQTYVSNQVRNQSSSNTYCRTTMPKANTELHL